MAETIIYRERISRVPTLDDRAKKVGFEGFVRKLQEYGWIDEDRDTALRNFKVEYSGHAEEDNNYIEWTAILRN